MESGDPIASELDALYGGPLETFVAQRNALAGRLRAAGDVEGARRVKALPKPVATAWAVNVVALRRPELVGALLEAGEEVRRAQVEGAPAAALQEAVGRRRDRLNAALAAAREVLEEAGKAATPAALERVGRTLEALAAYGAHQPEPRAGRLAQDVEPPGFEVLAGLPLRPSAPPPERAEAPVVEESAHPEDPEATRAAELAARRAELRARAREARDAFEAARSGYEQADQRARELELRATQARAQADDARAALARAEAAWEEARAALGDEDGSALIPQRRAGPAGSRRPARPPPRGGAGR